MRDKTPRDTGALQYREMTERDTLWDAAGAFYQRESSQVSDGAIRVPPNNSWCWTLWDAVVATEIRDAAAADGESAHAQIAPAARFLALFSGLFA